MSSILRITDPVPSDNSIDEYEHVEYGPVVGTNLNNPGGDIRIDIETQDIFTHPSESFLITEGQITKNNNNKDPYADADIIFLTNNGIMYLFKTIKYQLSGQEIQTVTHPGQATTMLGLLKYPDDFSKSQGLNQMWYKDTTTEPDLARNTGFNVRKQYLIDSPDPKGTFSFRVPLKHIFGFCEDYNIILYGMKQTLTLTRNDDDDAIFRNNAAAGIIRLDKISWYMPHVMPADKEKMELYKIVKKKRKITSWI